MVGLACYGRSVKCYPAGGGFLTEGVSDSGNTEGEPAARDDIAINKAIPGNTPLSPRFTGGLHESRS